jgi:hypothetical protein
MTVPAALEGLPNLVWALSGYSPKERYMAELEPTPEQLSSPRGTPLTALSWADVRTQVAEADDFLLATTDPDGRPHVVPVLGVWLEGTVCFVTFQQSRKARNLVRNNGCAVTVPGHDVDLVLEGAPISFGTQPACRKLQTYFRPSIRGGIRSSEMASSTIRPTPPSMTLGTSTQLSRHRCSHSVRRRGSAPPAGASRCSDRTWPRKDRMKGTHQ